MNKSGTGKGRQDNPPKTLQPGPTPIRVNIGRAASGSKHPSTDRRTVLTAMALAVSVAHLSADENLQAKCDTYMVHKCPPGN